MKKIIRHQYFFQHPPEVVWEYLTKSELMEQWLMKNDFKPVLGHEFQFRTGGKPGLNFDGIFYCRVLEITPFKTLSYSWNCGPGEGRINLESVVIWELKPKDKGTEVLLEHVGFKNAENLDMYNALNHGWVEKFQNIEKLITASDNGSTNA